MIERINLAHLPTPVKRTAFKQLLNGPQIFTKDDQTGLAMGGNKTRKPRFLLAKRWRRAPKMR